MFVEKVWPELEGKCLERQTDYLIVRIFQMMYPHSNQQIEQIIFIHVPIFPELSIVLQNYINEAPDPYN